MFKDDYQAAGKGAAGKLRLLNNNPMGYFMASILAGIFIAFGCIMMGFCGGILSGLPAQKLVSGIVFSVGLCFVTMAGAELFTGNNFVMSAGSMLGTVTWMDTIKVWVVCYIGNWVGSIIGAVLFNMTGIGQSSEAVGTFFAGAAAAKFSGAPANLFAKAILCNILVCVAIWSGFRLKSEGAKMFMNFCCVGTFVTCGFEHSIANMTFGMIGLLNPMDKALTVGGYLYNLGIVTLGNMVGAIVFIAIPYYLVSTYKNN